MVEELMDVVPNTPETEIMVNGRIRSDEKRRRRRGEGKADHQVMVPQVNDKKRTVGRKLYCNLLYFEARI